MKINYSCHVESQAKTFIEGLLHKWAHNSPLIEDNDYTIEIQKILTRGYTSGITFLAAFGKPGQKRISRVFKVDYIENVIKEATAASKLSKTIAANFFCRIQNDAAKDFWEDEKRKKYGIIEYEYAGAMGTTETVYTLLDYIHAQFQLPNALSKKMDGICRAVDDVIQGLKTKVYTRRTSYNMSGREVYERKLKHFNLQFLQNLFVNIPEDVKPLFSDPQTDYDKINFPLGMGLNTHYYSDTIHGDLNPTNILVYEGHDREYGAMIDFLEMTLKEEEGFTPYFWDFARLEAEMVLSLFTKPFFEAKKAPELLPRIADILFNLQIITDKNDPLYEISKLLVNLRKSFFRTEGLGLDISFNTVDVFKSYYYNLLVFYISLTRFKNNPLESILALAMAKLTAEQVNQISSKWISDIILKEDSKPQEVTKKPTKELSGSNLLADKKKIMMIGGGVLGILLIIIIIFTQFGGNIQDKQEEEKNKISKVEENNLKKMDSAKDKESTKKETSKPIENQKNRIADNLTKSIKKTYDQGNKFVETSKFKSAINLYQKILDNPKNILKNKYVYSLFNLEKGKSYYLMAMDQKNIKRKKEYLDQSVKALEEGKTVDKLKESYPEDFKEIDQYLDLAKIEMDKTIVEEEELAKEMEAKKAEAAKRSKASGANDIKGTYNGVRKSQDTNSITGFTKLFINNSGPRAITIVTISISSDSGTYNKRKTINIRSGQTTMIEQVKSSQLYDWKVEFKIEGTNTVYTK